MTAPTFPYGAITLTEVQAGKPGKQELFEKLRANPERIFEILLASGVSPGDAAVAIGHRHLGPEVDGTQTIISQPQENLIAGGDNPSAFAGSGVGAAGLISFDFGSQHVIQRSTSAIDHGALTKAFVSANLIKKIKSSGGKGRFTCSLHMKRVAAAAGVVGGTLRFGLWDGSAWVTGAFVDIDFDDVTQEYQRFYFTSDQITRPTALNIRAEFTAEPTDWDTISNGDTVGYNGGYMVTNGGALAKWDISYNPVGVPDDYDADASNLFYWWDEIITEVELTV